jgi:hypothetical protein
MTRDACERSTVGNDLLISKYLGKECELQTGYDLRFSDYFYAYLRVAGHQSINLTLGT